MAEKLSWEEIKRKYDKQWVELVDYDWPDEEVYPRAGIVRIHACSRKEFDDLADVDPPKDSAYIFVGRRAPKGAAVLTSGYSQVIVG